MIPRPPRSTRTHTRFPDPPLFRSDAVVARGVTGTLTVPSYMTLANGRSGSRFYYGGDNSLDALPQINPGNPTMTAPFTCMIPPAAFGEADAPAAATHAVPARPSLYGHALPGSPDEEIASASSRERVRPDG